MKNESNDTGKRIRRIKTKKQITEKINIFEKCLDELDDKIKAGKLLPDQIHKMYDLKIQFSTGIGILKWVLGESQ